MTVFITILGLFTLVPTDGAVEVLFLDSIDRLTSEGHPVPQHQLQLDLATTTAAGEGSAPQAFLNVGLDGRVELGIHEAPQTPVTFVNPEDFLHLAEVLGPEQSLELQAGCTGPAALETCQLPNGQRLLAGRLRLTGGTLRPAEIFPDKVVLGAQTTESLKAVWEFRPFGTESTGGRFRTRTFNGALYEIRVDGEAAQLEVGGLLLTLRPVRSPQCAELGGGGLEACAIVHFSNSPIDIDTGGATGSSSLIDMHFDLMYDLLADPPAERLIPFLVSDPSNLRDDDESPPGSRCIPPVQGPGGG